MALIYLGWHDLLAPWWWGIVLVTGLAAVALAVLTWLDWRKSWGW